MKSVLTSIRPKWCELIASRKKTIVVRKTRPEIETPFKDYIYCTLDGGVKGDRLMIDGKVSKVVCGMVIGEFVCDEIEHFTKAFFDERDERDTEEIAYFLEESCLSYSELCNYVKLDDFYGWHISDLKIYDKPLELSKFYRHDSTYDNAFGWAFEDRAKRVSIARPPQSWMYVEELQ